MKNVIYVVFVNLDDGWPSKVELHVVSKDRNCSMQNINYFPFFKKDNKLGFMMFLLLHAVQS